MNFQGGCYFFRPKILFFDNFLLKRDFVNGVRFGNELLPVADRFFFYVDKTIACSPQRP